MRKKVVMRALAALAGGSVLAVTGVAGAQQTCSATLGGNATTIGDANTVFINGSSAVKSLLQHLAVVLYDEAVAANGGTAPALSGIVKIVYQSTASCQGAGDVVGGVTTDKAAPNYLDGSNGGATAACAISAQSWNVDIGASDVYPATCGPAEAIPAGSAFYDFHAGSVQVMDIAVPANASQLSISADAAYVVFGFGGTTYTIGTWTQGNVWVRNVGSTNTGSGTEAMIGSAIGLNYPLWLSPLGDAGAAQVVAGGSGGMASTLQNSTTPNNTIGILAASNVDPNKGTKNVLDGGAVTGGIWPLAFQAKGQDCGYYPDSTLSAFDKINVRQGRYVIWGPHHWVTNTQSADASTPVPVGMNANDAAVQAVIAHLMHTGLSESSDVTLINAEAGAWDVPACAMQVARTGEVSYSLAEAGEMSYLPPKGCGCYFEHQRTGATFSSYCQTCDSDAGTGDAGACPTEYPHCNYGYCEVQ